MDESKPGVGKWVLANLCRVCPFCIAAKIFPNSGFAKKLKSVESNCPACRAYYEVYIRKGADAADT